MAPLVHLNLHAYFFVMNIKKPSALESDGLNFEDHLKDNIKLTKVVILSGSGSFL